MSPTSPTAPTSPHPQYCSAKNKKGPAEASLTPSPSGGLVMPKILDSRCQKSNRTYNFQYTFMPPLSAIPVPTTLSRAVRVFISRDGLSSPAAECHNSFAGYPSTSGIGAWYEFEVSIHGIPEQKTGYLATLAQLDAAVRNSSIPMLKTALFSQTSSPQTTPCMLLQSIASGVATSLGRPIKSLSWNISPYHQYFWKNDMPTKTTLTSIFEFAASHRLNDPTRTPAENQSFFGKCNKLNGHGHNYRIAVSIAIPSEHTFGMAELEEVVDRVIIERFDHMNLNIDCPEFRATNPSVEHIAAVCFDLLKEPLLNHDAELKSVRLWETSKTSATVEAGEIA